MCTKKQLVLTFIALLCISLSSFGARFETVMQQDIIQEISSDLPTILSQQSNTLTIGKEYDDLLIGENGKINEYSVTFKIKKLEGISKFVLSNVSFKDHLVIKVNGKLLWSSSGKDFESLDTSKLYPLVINGKKTESFGLDGAPVETWEWKKQSLSIDAKKYLKVGNNNIELKLAVGGQGGVQAIFQVNQTADKKIECQNGQRICVKSGEQIIDGIAVSQDCWRYQYVKTCPYPSKNDCNKYADCTFIADRECLFKDKYGNCVNSKREMVCESTVEDYHPEDVVGFDATDKNARTRLVCTGFPCIDGSCVNQESEKNSEMLEVLSKLGAVSKAKGGDTNAKVFAGSVKACNNTRLLGYHNCCQMTGWGAYLGALCSAEEEQLSKLRLQNKCVFVGKQKNKVLGNVIHVSTKNNWCCFNSILDKIIQVQGRKQLGKTFGTGENPDCGGLSITEILRLDFDKIDFSEFYVDIVKQMKKPPQGSELKEQIKSMLPQEYQDGASREQNNRAGTNKNLPTVKGDY